MTTNAHGEPLELDGKVVLVTGAAQGLGAAIAGRAHSAGASVACCDIRHDQGRSVADRLGDRAAYVPLDVTEEESWIAARHLVGERFGGVDVLVNNAGILSWGPLVEVPLEEYLRLVMVNQVGCFLGMKTCADAIAGRGGGAIVNISSALGLVGMANFVAYAATKFAVRGMTKVAAAELGPRNIRVNSVHPTGVRTPMSDPERFGRAERDTSRVPLRRLADPMEVADLVCFLASDRASYCTGSEFVVDGGVLSQQHP